MPLLIKGRAIIEDRWTLLRDARSLADISGETAVIVPLALWKSEHETLVMRQDVGVWLKPDDDPGALAADIDSLPLIAIDFPKFVDGRGYSSARLLRDKYRFGGELRGDRRRFARSALLLAAMRLRCVRGAGGSQLCRRDRRLGRFLRQLPEHIRATGSAISPPQGRDCRRRQVASDVSSISMALETRAAEALALLHRIGSRYASAALASSFGAEDMVLTDLIARNRLPIAIFTLDTGRLPGETYALIDRVREHYGVPIEVYCPDTRAIEVYVRDNGVNAFYHSVELRQSCCAIRKSEPLARALAGRGAWITGQRRAQSVTRTAVESEETDAAHAIRKFNPLADWSEGEVWTYIRDHDVPYNLLHDRGYPSIGCAPCTRAIQPGEDIRAGRWWWESADHKECGLHRRPLDVIVRAEGVPA